MKTSWLKISSTFSLVIASALTAACGAGDDNEFNVDQESATREESGFSDDTELGSLEQAIHNCSNPDGTNAVMAALAVAAAQELKRWRAGLDFEQYSTNGAYEGQPGNWSAAIRLTSGTGSDGKPRGKSRCGDGKCAKIQALLSLQYDNATGVYVQAESSNNKVQVNPSALRSRMVAKLQEQLNKDRDMKDGDTYQSPKAPHTLTSNGSANLGGCGPHFKFKVAFDPTTTNPKPLPVQLKWTLSFADQQNGWVDFKDLGNNVVGVDPTYGLNEGAETTAGSCPVACTKVSTSDISNGCCSCAGASKRFKRSTFNTALFLCQ
jgi:hypothetical protein